MKFSSGKKLADSDLHSSKINKYINSVKKLRQKTLTKVAENNRTYDPSPSIPYITGQYVGDPNDDVIAADGLQIFAATLQAEQNAQQLMSVQIADAKDYLLSLGLDFSDVYDWNDPRYIHAANLMVEVETYINNQSSSTVARENTTFGCIMQAVGIQAAADLFLNKKLTKQLIIAVVGKVASKYLGAVGALIAAYDFVDCMGWLEDKV